MMTFLSRLAALIPAPRVNLVTYHGLLAPAASYRDRVVPTAEEEVGESCVKHQGAGGLDGRGIGMPKPKERKKRLLWAEAMKRGLDLDVLKCGHCGGRREGLKCITAPKVIARILTHLGLKTVLPEVAPARAPPGSELLFEY